MKKNIGFKLSPLFFITYFLLARHCGVMMAMAYISAIVLHELSHIYVADKLGVTTKSFILSYYGCRADMPALDTSDSATELAIICAGPTMNLCSAIIFALFSQVFYSWYYPLMDFAMWNMYLGIFNLLPLLPLDGGRILKSILSLFVGRRNAVRVCATLSIVCGAFGVIVTIYYAFYGRYIVFPAILGLIVIFGSIKERKGLLRYDTLVCKRTVERPKRVRRIAIDADEDIRRLVKYFNEDCYNIVDFVGKDGAVKRTLTEQQIIDEIIK